MFLGSKQEILVPISSLRSPSVSKFRSNSRYRAIRIAKSFPVPSGLIVASIRLVLHPRLRIPSLFHLRFVYILRFAP